MYHTGSLFDGRFPSEAWTGQRGLFTDWDYLLRECITVLLHEKKIQLGMLNPYAEIFIPQSQKNNQSNGNKGKREDEVVDRKKMYENKPQMTEISKPQLEVNTTLKSKTNNEKDDTTTTTKNTHQKEKTTINNWKTSNKSIKRNHYTRKADQEDCKTINKYEILREIDGDDDESELNSSESVLESSDSTGNSEDEEEYSWSETESEPESEEDYDTDESTESTDAIIEKYIKDNSYQQKENDSSNNDESMDFTTLNENHAKDMTLTREELVHRLNIKQRDIEMLKIEMDQMKEEIIAGDQVIAMLDNRALEAEIASRAMEDLLRKYQDQYKRIDPSKKVEEMKKQETLMNIVSGNDE